MHLDALPTEPREVSPIDSSTCTSITTLDLGSLSPHTLKRIVSLISHPLTLLVVSALLLDPDADRMPSELVEVFDLPSMAQLQRWRMSFGELMYISSDIWSLGPPTPLWVATCRARGIEPRGDERYFSGALLYPLLFLRAELTADRFFPL